MQSVYTLITATITLIPNIVVICVAKCTVYVYNSYMPRHKQYTSDSRFIGKPRLFRFSDSFIASIDDIIDMSQHAAFVDSERVKPQFTRTGAIKLAVMLARAVMAKRIRIINQAIKEK